MRRTINGGKDSKKTSKWESRSRRLVFGEQGEAESLAASS